MIDVGTADIYSIPPTDAPVPAVARPAKRHILVFLCTGEGEHDENLDIAAIHDSPTWSVLERAIVALPGMPYTALEQFIKNVRGKHDHPYSPLLSTAISILHADLWRSWGYMPGVTLGHSSGEAAAAYIAGVFSVEEAVRTAHQLGQAGAELSGGMLYTQLRRSEVDAFDSGPDAAPRPTAGEGLCLAAFNSEVSKPGEAEELVSVTLSGPEQQLADWLAQDTKAKKLRPQRPWHHPAYATTAGLAMVDGEAHGLAGGHTAHGLTECSLVSATTAAVVSTFEADHWQRWLTRPVQFAAACRVAGRLLLQRAGELPGLAWAAGAPTLVPPVLQPKPVQPALTPSAEQELYEKLGLTEAFQQPYVAPPAPQGMKPSGEDRGSGCGGGGGDGDGGELGDAVLVEVGCHPSLLAHAAAMLSASGVRIIAQAASMKRNMPAADFLAAQKARLEVLLEREATGGGRRAPATPQR